MPDGLADAVAALARGELVVYPTDTLLGLGARADRALAVERLIAAKGRPSDRAISIAVSSYAEIERWAELRDAQRAHVRRLLPGPFTLLLTARGPARDRLSPRVIGPNGTIGVRIPDHPVARELLRRAGPVTATSANRHGRAPARTVAEARRELGELVRTYLPARPRPSGIPSQLVDLTGPEPRPVRRR